MIRKYVLPLIAAFGLAFAIASVVRGSQPIPAAPPVAEPAKAPFASYVAGAGIIEASTENIAIGSPVPGIVTKVNVKVGDVVDVGQVLFEIDDRDLRAQRLVAAARVDEARANLERSRMLLRLAESVPDKRAISAEDLSTRRSAVAIDQAALESAKAMVEQIEIELDRRQVRALMPGQILQVKTRPGEFAPAGVMAVPLMLLGNHTKLHVRVDIDENDAWRFARGAEAVAFVRGNAELTTPLRFERIEPYVVPKVSLTGLSSERVDTRVLQVIYSFDEGALPVYVGQQMDVFIEAKPIAAQATPATGAPGATSSGAAS
jgi:RND family efflux transporter MFP subunit